MERPMVCDIYVVYYSISLQPANLRTQLTESGDINHITYAIFSIASQKKVLTSF